MEALKQAVRASVRALALEALNSEASTTISARAHYEAMENVVNEAVADALVPIAVKYNNKRPAIALPDDMLFEVVSRLPLPDRLRAAQVCQRWRAALLRNPALWTRVSLTLHSDGDLTHLPDALSMLFTRSQALALVVELMLRAADNEESHTFKPYGAYSRVAELLKQQMPRIKSQSLIIPDYFEPRWKELLVTPAPKLETLRLIMTSNDQGRGADGGEATLSNDLFACRAPLLRHAYLVSVWLNEDAYPALEGLTSLFFDFAREVRDQDLQNFLSLTQLRYLTIMHDLPESRGTRIPQPVRLQLWNIPVINDFVASFPHARYICYSAGLEKDGVQDRDLAALVDAITEYPNPVSFEVARRAPLLPDDGESVKPRLAIRINGRDLIVDMLYSVLFDLFARLPPLPLLFHTVRRLAVVEELLPSINVQGLPALDELTLYMTRRDDTVYRTVEYLETDDVAIGLQLHMLRIIRSSSEDLHNRMPSWRIGIDPILRFVSVKLASGTLARLILCGFKVSGAEVQQLHAGGVQRVVMDHAPGILGDDDDCGPWRWQFPEEEAQAL